MKTDRVFWGTKPHHGAGVYGPGREAVNRGRKTASARLGRPGGRPLPGAFALFLLTAGCAAPPASKAFHPVGVAYSLELARILYGGDCFAQMDRDFASLRQIGFDTVLIEDTEDADRRRVTELAAEHSLRPILPTRAILYYVRTGRLPGGCPSPEALAGSMRWPHTDPPTLLSLGLCQDEEAAQRVAHIAKARQAGDPSGANPTFALAAGAAADSAVLEASLGALACLPSAGTGPGRVLWLECPAPDSPHEADGDDPHGVPDSAGAWLAQYHVGLAAGLTGGVLLHRFRGVPGQGSAIVEGAEPLSPHAAAAVRRVAARARRWGPRLDGLTPRAVAPDGAASDELRAVLFSGGKRRFLLLFNASTTAYIHHQTRLPSALDGQPVERAVEVPADGHVLAGQVVPARADELVLPLDLAPGDGALWELF